MSLLLASLLAAIEFAASEPRMCGVSGISSLTPNIYAIRGWDGTLDIFVSDANESQNEDVPFSGGRTHIFLSSPLPGAGGDTFLYEARMRYGACSSALWVSVIDGSTAERRMENVTSAVATIELGSRGLNLAFSIRMDSGREIAGRFEDEPYFLPAP
jgi:hypothetical protein